MLTKKATNSGLALFALLFGLAAATAHAQATRTWVSGVGDDANPCSRTAPCKTFAGAIAQTAAGGEIDALDPGGFGAVTITKAITIDGGAGQIAGVLVSGTNGIVIQAGPNDVVRLRNLDINGLGTGLNGIRFVAGAGLEVHNVHVYQFTQQGIDFEAPTSAQAFLTVTDSQVENNGGGAIWLTGAGTPIAFITNVNMQFNARGLRAEDGSVVHVKNSVASNNNASGFVALGTSRAVTLNLDHCAAFRNTTGVYAGSNSNVNISDTTVTSNTTGLLLAGGGINSAGNNTVIGNGTNGAPSSMAGQM
jgi:hypothetical protein